MRTSRIKKVVLGLKDAITNINPKFDDFERVLALYYESFELSIETLLPSKTFAVRENEFEEYEIAIFDDEETCDKWIKDNSTDYECYKIPETRFYELSQDEWRDPDCFSEENGVLVFRLI